MNSLFIEAESFKNLGGWVVDQQSMHIMGSSYIMAHGMGEPVADATTFAALPQSGRWYAYARTRDWSAVWKRGSAAGVFKLKVNDTYFENVLGNNGENWDWQYAGALNLPAGKVKLSICDLTGFNGRCDAIYLTTDKNDVPENTEEFRIINSGVSPKDDTNFYDLIVCGGGIAGTCMALSAVYKGLKTLLINDRPVLGGCNSSEIKVGLGGWTRSKPYPKLGNTLEQIAPVFGAPGSYPAHVYEDDRKANAFLTAKRWAKGDYTLALGERVFSIEKQEDKITAVTTKNIYSGEMTRYRGNLFADCTGDAFLARMSGCETMYGREAQNEFGEEFAPENADRQVMGMTITWYSTETDSKVDFPDIDWGIAFDEDRSYKVDSGDWEWEAGQYRDMADETEYIRDYSLMTIFGNWSFLKNRCKNKAYYQNRRLEWVSPYGGKRESYRVKGDLILNQNDVENQIPYDDGTASMTWNIDIHFPDPLNVKLFGEPFRSCAIHRTIKDHYPVPYRCLYSKDVKNLFLGGRIISCSSVAFACVRVMRTLGVLGEVVGLAASICKSENCMPRDIYMHHFDKLRALMGEGVTIDPYHAYDFGDKEHFAFPECNKFFTSPYFSLPLDDKQKMWQINNLGIKYHGYEKFKGIEDRDTLTAEEKEIARRFHKSMESGKYS